MTALSYTDSGNPRLLTALFLHGFMGSARDWKDVTAALESDFRCLAVDLPGHGGSLGLPYPDSYTIEGAAQELTRLLDSLGVTRPAVVGYSMGGRLALYLALHHPERCAALLLESVSPGIEDEEERRSRRAADEVRAKRLETENFEAFLEDWYRQPLFATLARRKELLRQTIESKLSNDPRELAQSLRAMGAGSQPSLWEDLPKLRVPTLTVVGELDEKYVGVSQRMASLNCRIQDAVIPGAGHNAHAEAPKAYLGLLRSFLKSI